MQDQDGQNNKKHEFSALCLAFITSWIEFWFVNKEPKYLMLFTFSFEVLPTLICSFAIMPQYESTLPKNFLNILIMHNSKSLLLNLMHIDNTRNGCRHLTKNQMCCNCIYERWNVQICIDKQTMKYIFL